MRGKKSVVFAVFLLLAAFANGETKTYFSPDDDTQQVVLDFASSSQKSILIAAYSFTCAPLADILVQKHAAAGCTASGSSPSWRTTPARASCGSRRRDSDSRVAP